MDKLSKIKKRLNQKPSKSGFNKLLDELLDMIDSTQFNEAFDLVSSRIHEGTDADRTLIVSSWNDLDRYKPVLMFARRIELQ